MKLRTFALIGLGSLVFAGQPALATAQVGDPLAALQAMRELNVVVFGDAQGWLEVQGKTVIGGNLKNGGEFGIGNSSHGAASSGRATLTVGGNTTGNIINLVNGSNGGNGAVGAPASVVVGGNFAGANVNTGNATVQVGGTIRNTNGSSGSVIEAGGAGNGYLNANGGSITTNKGAAYTADLRAGINAETAKLESDLTALSQSLAGMGNTAGNTITNQYGAYTLNAVADANGVSVFNLTEAALNGWQFTLNVADPTMTVVFNVTGDGKYNWNTGLAGIFGADFAGNVIWNFADATSIGIEQTVYGSILAPLADLTAKSAIYGSVVSEGLKANSGVKLGTYEGSDFGFAPSGAVPEPATWAMLIIGFGFVGAALRRRERGVSRVSA